MKVKTSNYDGLLLGVNLRVLTLTTFYYVTLFCVYILICSQFIRLFMDSFADLFFLI